MTPIIPAGVRSFLRNSGYVFAGHVTTTLIAFGYAVALARYLGRDLYGILAYGFSWYLTFIALSYLGLDILLGREIGRDRSQAPGLAGSTLGLRAAAGGTFAVVSSAVGALVEPDPKARSLLLIFGVALFARAIWLWCTSVFAAFEDTRRGLLIDIVCRPLEPTLAALVSLALAPKSVVAIGVVHAAVWSLQAAVGLTVVVRLVTPISFGGLRNDAGRLLRQGLPGALYALTVVWFLQAPIVLFRQVEGTGVALGHFALALQILGYLMVIPYLAGGVALPILSRSSARNDGKTRTAALASVIGIPAVGVIVGVLGLWLAPATARLIFGAGYEQTGKILGEAIWLLIPMSLAISLQQIQFSSGRRLKLGAVSAILGMATMAVLFAPLTDRHSYHGAVIATGIGMIIWAGGLVLAVIPGGPGIDASDTAPD